ncbi:MAG: nitrite reductase small subunit NirD [Rhodospirillales bacterium]
MTRTDNNKRDDDGWLRIGALRDIPVLGSRVVETPNGNIAVFRNRRDEIFALRDECPHKKGPLSQGIVHGTRVTCPLHNWVIQLEDGNAVAPDVGCVRTYPVRLIDGILYLRVAGRPAAASLDTPLDTPVAAHAQTRA